MIIRANRLDYRYCVDNLFYKLPVIYDKRLKTLKRFILESDSFKSLKEVENSFMGIISKHCVSYTQLDSEGTSLVYVELYSSTIEMVKVSLLDVLLTTSSMEGQLLKDLLKSTYFISELYKDFDEVKVDECVNILVNEIPNLNLDTLGTGIDYANKLNTPVIQDVIYRLSNMFNEYFEIKQVVEMDIDDFVKAVKSNEMLYKYFTKMLVFQDFNKDANLSFACTNIDNSLNGYFANKSVVSLRAFSDFEVKAIDNYVAILKWFVKLPLANNLISLKSSICNILSTSEFGVGLTNTQKTNIAGLLYDEVLRASISNSTYVEDNLYDALIQQIANSL